MAEDEAYCVKNVKMLSIIPVYYEYDGELIYRLTGIGKDGRKLSKITTKEIAEKYGEPQKIFKSANEIKIENYANFRKNIIN